MGLIDHGLPNPVRMKRGTILVLALNLAKELKEQIPDKRVGVVLPSGLGGVLANLGLILADKIPVNLNFTIGEESLRYSMKKAEVSTVISAAAVREKITDFPWPQNIFDLGSWLRNKRKQKGQMIWNHLQADGLRPPCRQCYQNQRRQQCSSHAQPEDGQYSRRHL